MGYLNMHLKFMSKTNTLVALSKDVVSINPSALGLVTFLRV